MFLSDVDCRGSEANLLECRHTLFVGTYCTHQRDVGLRCEGKWITDKINWQTLKDTQILAQTPRVLLSITATPL